MRHLIVCCDGTWQKAEQQFPTNVFKLEQALSPRAADGAEQLARYFPGVGSSGSPWNWLAGGFAGAGLSEHVMTAYHWLASTYRDGDQISLFGFSRGAFTVRSLAGMIGACGLLDIAGLDEPVARHRVRRVYRDSYRRQPVDPKWRRGLAFSFDPAEPERIPVRFIGVWDTVGSLGIPEHLSLLNLVNSPRNYQFHNITLNPHIRYGRHALALDEFRGPFTPTRWLEPEPAPDGPLRDIEQDIQQVWFPGDHGDVGGGHAASGLSNGALSWMIREASVTVGLRFDQPTVDSLQADPLAALHEDTAIALGPMSGIVEALFQPRPRAVPIIDPDNSTSRRLVHESAHERQKGTAHREQPYRETRTLDDGEPATADVSAQRRWNATGLYLEPGTHRFTATGEWSSSGGASGPGGETGRNMLRPRAIAHLVGTLLGQGERLYRRIFDKRGAEFLGARREEDLPWMSLVGVVANETTDAKGAVIEPHEHVAIGTTAEHRVVRPGYLYAFANDAWGFYRNNRGAVRMTVTRTSGKQPCDDR